MIFVPSISSIGARLSGAAVIAVSVFLVAARPGISLGLRGIMGLVIAAGRFERFAAFRVGGRARQPAARELLEPRELLLERRERAVVFERQLEVLPPVVDPVEEVAASRDVARLGDRDHLLGSRKDRVAEED